MEAAIGFAGLWITTIVLAVGVAWKLFLKFDSLSGKIGQVVTDVKVLEEKVDQHENRLEGNGHSIPGACQRHSAEIEALRVAIAGE